MADAVIRKACDRCHHQKLSCKRTNEQSCERCRKIKVKCTWSPSLRYKKSQQLQQQQQSLNRRKQQRLQPQIHFEAHEGETAGTPSTAPERRSPKRRRTGSDPDLVSPETVPIVSQPVTAESQPNASKPLQGPVAAVTPGSAGLDIREFDFNLGQLEFFDGAQQQNQHQHHHQQQQLPQGAIQAGIEQYHQHHHPQQPPHGFFGGWEQTLTEPHNGYVDLTTNHLTGHSNQTHDHIGIPDLPLVQRSRAPLLANTGPSSGSNTTARRRGRRLIALRASQDIHQEVAGSSNLLSDLSTPLHWMARLSEINARLQALASLLPAQFEAAEGGLRNQSFPVDEMFQLTRQIADVLDQLCNSARDDSGSHTEDPGTGRSGQAKLDGSDPGSAMFVLSVYVMLLDLYHKVFTLVRSEVFQQASTATFAFWKLPDVTIGSFAVESTPSLQMSLTIQLAEEFLSRLRRSTTALDPSHRSSGHGSIFTGVVDASLQEIKSSEDSLRQELAALRDRIEEMLEG